MADTTLGTAYVQIMPSAKGIAGSIKNTLAPEATSAGESTGQSLGSTIVSKVKGIIAAAGIGAAFKASLEAGGDLQQSFGGLETIYGEAATAAKNYAREAAQAGISANDYAEQAVSFGAALKMAYGGDTTKAVEAANTALLDMADNSAKMGTDIGSLQTAYQGFAKQNYTMLDNLKLGYGGTKEEMQRLLTDAEKLSGVKYDISNLGDVYDAIHVVQENLGLTGVAAQEASETFSGSLGAMKAAATNLMADISLGNDISADLAVLDDAVFAFTKNLLPMVGNVLQGLPDVISGAFSTAIGTLNFVANNAHIIVPQGIELVMRLAQAVVDGLPYLIEAGVRIVTVFGRQLLTYDWIGAASELMSSLGSSLSTAASEIFGTDDPGQILSMIGQGISNALPNLLSKGSEIIQTIIDGITTFAVNLPTTMVSIATTAGEFFKSIDWIGIGSSVLQFVIDGISSLGSSLWTIVTTLGTQAGELFKSIDWQTVGYTALTFVINGISTLGSALGTIVQTIGAKAGELFDGIDWATVGTTALNFVINGISSLGGALGSLVKGIGDKAGELFKGVNWASVGTAAINFIINGIRGIMSLVPNTLRTIGSTAMSAFTNIDWASVGRNVISGIAGGISGAAGAIADAARTAASNALDAAKKFLGIKSPSRVFRDQVGKMIPLGAAAGIEAEAGVVTDAVDDMWDAAVPSSSEISAAMSMPAGSGSRPATGNAVTYNVPITINAAPGMDERRLADYVIDRITMQVRQERAAWGGA